MAAESADAILGLRPFAQADVRSPTGAGAEKGAAGGDTQGAAVEGSESRKLGFGGGWLRSADQGRA